MPQQFDEIFSIADWNHKKYFMKFDTAQVSSPFARFFFFLQAWHLEMAWDELWKLSRRLHYTKGSKESYHFEIDMPQQFHEIFSIIVWKPTKFRENQIKFFNIFGPIVLL